MQLLQFSSSNSAHCRPWLVAALGALLPLVSACGEYSDPADFDDERESLQEEWEGNCDDPCAGEEDDPAACGIVGNKEECAAYNLTEAKACLRAYKRVIRKDVCDADDGNMVELGNRCNAVYSACGLDGTGTDGMDTDGTGTDGEDTDGTETEGGSETA